MKIPTEYGGLGLSMSYYGRALMLAGSVHPSIGRSAVGAPVDRRTGAGEDVRHRGAEGRSSCRAAPVVRSARSC